MSGALCVGPGALCVGPGRSVCRARALCGSDPHALCVWPGAVSRALVLHRAQFLKDVQPCSDIFLNFNVRSNYYSELNIFWEARRSVLRAPALCVSGPALCASGLGAVSVAPPRSLCQAPGALCVGPRRSLWGPACSAAMCIQHCWYVSWRLNFQTQTFNISVEL